MMTWIDKAWRQAMPTINSIFEHPFNQKLQAGSLDRATFAYYMEQDYHYLADFTRCHQYMLNKAPRGYSGWLRKYANLDYVYKQEAWHHDFCQRVNYQHTGLVTPAALHYRNRLVHTCAYRPLSLNVAATLPCLLIYRELGHHLCEHISVTNPYKQWIHTYISEGFSRSTDQAVSAFDTLAQQASTHERELMIDTFCHSMRQEWLFWDDACHGRYVEKRLT